jgi:hypothetical protein
MLFCPLKPSLECECAGEALYFLGFGIVIAGTDGVDGDEVKVTPVINVNLLLHFLIRFSESALVRNAFSVELRESLQVVVVIWRWDVGILGFIEYSPLRESEAEALFKLCVLSLEYIFD